MTFRSPIAAGTIESINFDDDFPWDDLHHPVNSRKRISQSPGESSLSTPWTIAVDLVDDLLLAQRHEPARYARFTVGATHAIHSEFLREPFAL